MIDKIKKMLQPSGQKNMKVIAGSEESFGLFFRGEKIGVLHFSNKIWKFWYTDAFRQSDNLSPVANFPDANKVYESERLWPFFSVRIPSLKRKRIKDLVKKEGIREDDLIALLRRFGKQTLTNPFILKHLP
jgi:HipA-like protein